MINPPRTKEAAQAHRYHEWSGNPRGWDYKPNHCAYEVWGGHYLSYQCMRKPGHGPDELYCKQHARMVTTK